MATGKWVQTESAIAEAEKETSAEIRVHLSRRIFEGDPLKNAEKVFRRLKMDQTKGRNGVLLYVQLRKRRFAIFGDTGIHEKVGQSYWTATCQGLAAALKTKQVDLAIAETVSEIGKTLKKYFPNDPNQANPNELSNQVSQD
ncbi:MAG: TPM domain-containing protein [Bdellovibrionales bacterium]|nr:TPM domain-containing protein [Bdellovibrionales bacterium]